MKSLHSLSGNKRVNSNLNAQSETQLEPKVKPSKEKHFTVAQIAKKLSTTPKTVRDWCSSGRMVNIPVPFGTKTSYKISASALDEFLTKNGDTPRQHSWAKGSAYAFLIANWKQSMAKGLFNGKPFSPITVSYYASYVELLLRKHGTFSYPAIKAEFLSIPVVEIA
jgi:hypothetical protein